MKTINLFSLALVLLLITTGCKKEEPRPAPQGKVETVKRPIDTVESAKTVQSLHEAAATGDIQQIKSLVSGGADVNAKDDKGNAPIHYAVLLANKDVIELLIASGADVNLKDDQGHTALWWAKEQQNDELTDLLLKHGAKE